MVECLECPEQVKPLIVYLPCPDTWHGTEHAIEHAISFILSLAIVMVGTLLLFHNRKRS